MEKISHSGLLDKRTLEVLRSLEKAKVVNLDASLRAVVDASESVAIDGDGIDRICYPFMWVHPPRRVDYETLTAVESLKESVQALNQSIQGLSKQRI
jgi:hypothetical protein